METKKQKKIFGTILSFNSNLFIIYFGCDFCRSFSFTLKDKNPMLGVYCSGCGKFHSINSKKLLIQNLTFSKIYFDKNKKIINSETLVRK